MRFAAAVLSLPKRQQPRSSPDVSLHINAFAGPRSKICAVCREFEDKCLEFSGIFFFTEVNLQAAFWLCTYRASHQALSSVGIVLSVYQCKGGVSPNQKVVDKLHNFNSAQNGL